MAEAAAWSRAARALITSRANQTSHPLSARELEVPRFVSRGLPNKLIARELGITEKTVKAHLTSIFHRIGVSDRVPAALWARTHEIAWSPAVSLLHARPPARYRRSRRL